MKANYSIQSNYIYIYIRLTLTFYKVNSKLQKILIIFFLFWGVNIKVNAQFETHFGSRPSGNDQPSNELITCPSISPNYEYVSVQSFLDSTAIVPIWTIRGFRINANGTRFTTSFDVIQEFANNMNIFPLKIIPFDDQNGNDMYLITGYVTMTNAPTLPKPFIIQADANLDCTSFKILSDHPGFFTDVDQLTNGDLIFAGSATTSLNHSAYTRLGWIMRTDNANFTMQWMRYTHLFEHPSIDSHWDFDIINDVVLIDDDSAIICGTVSIEQNPGCAPVTEVDSTISYVFLANVNLNNGSFNWQTGIKQGTTSARIALNTNDSKIAVACHARGNLGATLSFFDRGGNPLFSRSIEGADAMGVTFNFLGTNYPLSRIRTHEAYIQNIYFNSNDEDVFISGKFMERPVWDQNGAIIGYFDMPFSSVYSAINDNLGANMSLYASAQRIQPGYINFLTYNITDPLCNNFIYYPFYTPSNTLPCTSGCNLDEYVTATLDVAEDANTNIIGRNKIWIFTNDTSPCHYIPIGYTLEPALFEHIQISNDNIEVTPETQNINFNNLNPNNNLHDCDQ